MATALLKTGETVELPIDAMIDFVIRNRELVQAQHFAKPLPPRRRTAEFYSIAANLGGERMTTASLLAATFSYVTGFV